jgi:hypothetical protein
MNLGNAHNALVDLEFLIWVRQDGVFEYGRTGYHKWAISYIWAYGPGYRITERTETQTIYFHQEIHKLRKCKNEEKH